MGANLKRKTAAGAGAGAARAPLSGNAAATASSEAGNAVPLQADPALAAEYSCEVLHTTKGLLKGCWGQFQAVAIYRPLPARDSGQVIKALRHICIQALDLSKYAEREGESVQVDELGEGSYSKVYGVGRLAAKIISDRERPWVHKAAVENSFEADTLGLGPHFYGHGRLKQLLGGHFQGTVLLLERLEELGEQWSKADTQILLQSVRNVSEAGFHNDVKLQNLLRREGRPVLIDFDLMSKWTVKVAVTSNCIEHEFQNLLEPLGKLAWSFREYYDLFTFSLTLEDGDLYRAVLQRLCQLWLDLEGPVFRAIFDVVEHDALLEVPFEVLVRVPLQGITVNLLDLRGNLFAHLNPDGEQAALWAQCKNLPQLLKSNGVYWPQ